MPECQSRETLINMRTGPAETSWRSARSAVILPFLSSLLWRIHAWNRALICWCWCKQDVECPRLQGDQEFGACDLKGKDCLLSTVKQRIGAVQNPRKSWGMKLMKPNCSWYWQAKQKGAIDLSGLWCSNWTLEKESLWISLLLNFQALVRKFWL